MPHKHLSLLASFAHTSQTSGTRAALPGGRLARGVIVVVLLLTCHHSSATAQTVEKPTDGLTPSALTAGAPTGAYALSGFETVNPYNGGLNFSLPLLQVGGRGGAGYAITMRIDHKWYIRREINPGHSAFFYPTPGWINEDGGTLKELDYGVGRLTARYAITRNQSHTLARLTFTAPDGTEYELRDVQTNGTPHATTWNDCVFGNYYNRGRVFVTADGTSATFIADVGAEVKDLCGFDTGDSGPAGYMILKDGTRFRIQSGGGVEWMRDRNGNLINFAYTFNSQGQKITTVTDALNRVVTITEGSPVTIAYKGFGAVDRTVKVHTTTLGSALRSGYAIRTQNSLFPGLNNPAGTINSSPAVVGSVELPNGRFYVFKYNDYGELARIELPTGGALEYDYAPGLTDGPESGMLTDANNQKQVYRRVVERRVYPEGGSGTGYAVKQVYIRPESSTSNLGYVDVYQCTSGSAAGVCGTGAARLGDERHYYFGSPRLSFNKKPVDYSDWQEGREYETRINDPQTGALLRKVEQKWEQPFEWAAWPITSGTSETNPSAKPNNPQLTQTTTTLAETNQLSRQTFAYDQYGNQTDAYTYDYGAVGSGGVGGLLRRTHTDYVTAAAYVNADVSPALGAGLRGLPSQQWVSSDAAGNTRVSLTTYAYDQFAPEDCSLIIGHDAAYGTGFNTRGNMTGATGYTSAATATGAVTTSTHFDIAGNAVSATDANGNTSYVSYADNFSDGNNSRHAFAYPTTTTSAAPNAAAVPNPSGGPNFSPGAFGSTTGLVATTAYDFRSGLASSVTDPNGKTTAYDYNDPLNRLVSVTRPDGGTTSYLYDRYNNAGLLREYVRTMTSLDSARSATAYQYYDGLGRPSRTFLYEGGAPELYLTTDTQYDPLGRVKLVSNPHRTTGSDQPINPPGLWTTTEYDTFGRVRKTTTPDGASVYTLYDGARTLVTDQAGVQRVGKTDSLGRLTEVWEVRSPDAASGTESVSFPIPTELSSVVPAVSAGYKSAYTYDALGNLSNVTQGTQPARVFNYDSLSRISSAQIPEGGTVSYTYDGNGNLKTRSDARGVLTSYTYDGLNRNIIVHYAGGATATADVYRHYDNPTVGKNGLGRLWWNGTDISATGVNGYDAVGRTLERHQNFLNGGVWSGNYSVQVEYNLAGGVTKETYPSGHTVKYNYDAAGRLGDNPSQPAPQAVTGDLGDGVLRTYADQVKYNAFGGVEQQRFGTQTPLYHKLHYNRRGQPYDIRLSTQSLQADEWDWNRGALVNYYSGNYAWEGNPATPPAADNNGNLRRAEVYVPLDAGSGYNGAGAGPYYTAQQTYAYDALNRIGSVSEAHYNSQTNTSPPTFTQVYNYDRWGNRTINPATTDGIPEPQFSVSTSTNRLGVPVGSPKRMDYDAAGNLVNDTYSSFGRDDGTPTRVYDGENRLTTVKNDILQVVSAYTYDADGRRVRRKVGSQEWWQVYGMGGELLAEYPAAAATNSPRKEHGYRGGQLLVTAEAGTASAFTQSVTWTNAAGVTGNITKNVANGWGNSGASSSQTIAAGDGYVEFKANFFSGVRACGLSNGDTDKTMADIDFAIVLGMFTNGSYGVYENGVQKFFTGSFVAGDTFRVAVEGGAVKYYRNGTVFYTSAAAPTYPLLADAALLTNGTDISAAVISAAGVSQSSMRWLVPDHLGTPRMVVDQTGALAGVNHHDYLPFGEDLLAGVGGRPGGQGYGAADNVRQKFTGQERDDETNLDYMRARYYSNPQGRFQTPDPLLSSARLMNPKSWNRYVYGLNNPVRIVDPNGLYNLDANCLSDKKCSKNAERLKKGIETLTEKVKNMKEGDEKTRLQHALNAMGTENDGNKVKVVFDKLSGTAAARTDPTFDQATNSYSGFTVTFDMSKSGNNDSTGMAINAAHEGTHVSDYDDVYGRMLKPETGMLPFQIEYRAYQTSAWAAKALGVQTLSFGGQTIWNASWAASDVKTMMDRGITAYVPTISPDHAETPIHNPWPDRIPERVPFSPDIPPPF